MAGKVTALKPQARNSHRVNVEIDGRFAFALGDLLAATVRVGQHLSDDAVASLRQRDQAERAYDRALRFLTYRPRSRAEVSRYLADQGIGDDLAAATVARLQRAGLLDDAAFARSWVENRESLRPRGARALRYELRRKGLDKETIDAALEGVDEVASAYRLAVAQASRLIGVDRNTFRRRLGGFLSRRGYPFETVRETVERVWREYTGNERA
ncbi:MAG: regulatory protein RecX [Anaerolineae bacterium]